jgi:hypothetical protein
MLKKSEARGQRIEIDWAQPMGGKNAGAIPQDAECRRN